MNNELCGIVFSVLVSLLITGCIDEPMGPQTDQALRQAREGPISTVRFTGRDSFGVALKARVSGTWSVQESGCFELSGSGNASHLGQIEVTQTICPDGSEPTGTFSFTGRNGREISGEYLSGSVPPPGGGRLVLKDTITGESIPATPVDPEEGKADVTGTLHSNGRFDYRLEGWLLHHVR